MSDVRRSKRLKLVTHPSPQEKVKNPTYVRPEALRVVLQLLGPYMAALDLARCAMVSRAFADMAQDTSLIPRHLIVSTHFSRRITFRNWPALLPTFFARASPLLTFLDVSGTKAFPLSNFFLIQFPNLKGLRFCSLSDRHRFVCGDSYYSLRSIIQVIKDRTILPRLQHLFLWGAFRAAPMYDLDMGRKSKPKHAQTLQEIQDARPGVLVDVNLCAECNDYTPGLESNGVRLLFFCWDYFKHFVIGSMWLPKLFRDLKTVMARMSRLLCQGVLQSPVQS